MFLMPQRIFGIEGSMTRPLYLEEPKLDQVAAQVVALVSEGFIPDKTVFYPQGGGQPSDEGICEWDGKTFRIEGVRAAPEGLVHVTKEVSLQVGARVHLQIDPLKRLLHTSLHTAGHWISHILETDGRTRVTKSYHFPQGPYIECETDQDLETLSQRLLSALQKGLDAKISVDATHPGSRMITIQGFGTFPCGGTHLGNLSELPRVVIRGLKRKKGLVRVQYGLES